MAESVRGWNEETDALARRALERARDAALGKGLYPTRRRADPWEMASFTAPAADGTPNAGAQDSGRQDPGRQDPGARTGDAQGDLAAPERSSPSGWRAGPGLGAIGSGPGPSRRDPQGLAGVARRVLAQHGWSRPLAVAGVVGRWAEIVGPNVAENCHVETFTDGQLVVRCDSTAWATQLRLLLPQIERRLEEEVGQDAITGIEVRGPGGPSWKHGKWSVTGGRGPRDTYG